MHRNIIYAAVTGVVTMLVGINSLQRVHWCCRALAAAAHAVAEAAGRGRQPRLSELLIEETWQEQLAGELDKQYFHKLDKFVRQEWVKEKVFPPKPLVFRSVQPAPDKLTSLLVCNGGLRGGAACRPKP